MAELEEEFGPVIAERARSRGFPLASPLFRPQGLVDNFFEEQQSMHPSQRAGSIILPDEMPVTSRLGFYGPLGSAFEDRFNNSTTSRIPTYGPSGIDKATATAKLSASYDNTVPNRRVGPVHNVHIGYNFTAPNSQFYEFHLATNNLLHLEASGLDKAAGVDAQLLYYSQLTVFRPDPLVHLITEHSAPAIYEWSSLASIGDGSGILNGNLPVPSRLRFKHSIHMNAGEPCSVYMNAALSIFTPSPSANGLEIYADAKLQIVWSSQARTYQYCLAKNAEATITRNISETNFIDSAQISSQRQN